MCSRKPTSACRRHWCIYARHSPCTFLCWSCGMEPLVRWYLRPPCSSCNGVICTDIVERERDLVFLLTHVPSLSLSLYCILLLSILPFLYRQDLGSSDSISTHAHQLLITPRFSLSQSISIFSPLSLFSFSCCMLFSHVLLHVFHHVMFLAISPFSLLVHLPRAHCTVQDGPVSSSKHKLV